MVGWVGRAVGVNEGYAGADVGPEEGRKEGRTVMGTFVVGETLDKDNGFKEGVNEDISDKLYTKKKLSKAKKLIVKKLISSANYDYKCLF